MASASSSETVQKQTDHRRKSCDTVCSSNSSCFFQKRKPVHPLAANSIRPGVTRSGGSVRQRVLSAKLLKMRTLQNQLNDANFHLAELIKENRALKTLQKRQDKALSKYEGEDADLQKILRSYENQVRVLQEKSKILRKTVRELSEQLKARDEEVFSVREQLKHLTNLTKDKHLKEREKLTEEVEDLKLKLKTSDEQINLLNRKLMLEQKNSKHKLNNEMCKSRQFEKQLNEALSEINRLNGGSDFKTRGPIRKRLATITQRQAVSMVSLNPKEETSNTKLEPIVIKNHNIQNNSKLESILKSPTENIKARLSSAERRNVAEMSVSLEKINLNKPDTAKEETPDDDEEEDSPHQTKSVSHPYKINPLLQGPEKKKKIDEDELIGDYYKEIVSSVNRCNTTIDAHKITLEKSKEDADELMKKLQETDRITTQLKNTNFIADRADEMVNEILQEEYAFQKQNKQFTDEEYLFKVKDRNGNETRKESKVTLEEKRRLLETLKAIDNGETIDISITNVENRKSKLMKELFGGTDNCVRK